MKLIRSPNGFTSAKVAVDQVPDRGRDVAQRVLHGHPLAVCVRVRGPVAQGVDLGLDFPEGIVAEARAIARAGRWWRPCRLPS